MKQQAAQLAQQGRNGDSQLLHISPDELRGIASLGEITYNPVTGLPEAFSLGKVLKVALPIAAAIFAPYLLPMMPAAVAGGIGSGLATTALTGDIKRGLVSGVIGAGLGSAFGAAGKAAAGSAGDVGASAAAAGVIPSAGVGAAGIGSEVLGQGTQSMAQALGSAGATSAGTGAVSGGIGSLSAGEYATAPFKEPGAFTGQLMKPSTMIPMAMGAGQLSQWDMQEQARKMAEEQEEEKKKKRRAAFMDLQAAYRAAQPFAQSGVSPARNYMSMRTPQYMAEGGETEVKDFMDYAAMYPWLYGMSNIKPGIGIDPVTVQKNLRGAYSVAPQRQYMPGFNPEFSYFQDDPNNIQQAPPTYANTWTSMYRASPIQMAIMDTPAPWMQRIPTKPYFESILDRAVVKPEEEKKKNMAAGGDVTLNTSLGQGQVAGGGIANVPTEFNQPQPQEQELQMVAMAILGRVQNANPIIEGFISKYGVEVFRAVREMILQSVNPNAQTEGKIEGPGGGMDDQVQGTIGDQQRVAVSPGEYILPADVVSGLGDGSTDAGAQQLDQMAANVRRARGGSIQPPRIDPRRMLPA